MSQTPIVEQVMTRDPMIVAPNDPVRVAVERMRERGCRRLPVVESGKLVGVISDRDLRRATNSPLVLHERWHDEFLLEHIPVRACMSPNPVTVTPHTPIVDAAKLMRDRKFGGLPVVDDDILVGIVTETDLLNFLIHVLEGGS
ncbi:A-adding tRNA nucleotidyltransferase [Anaerolineae bacterium]|nr:A-adding tRNA nucleotidyltransferase [Anaerolineae bacterium]